MNTSEGRIPGGVITNYVSVSEALAGTPASAIFEERASYHVRINSYDIPTDAPVPSPKHGRGVPGGRGEGSYNKSLTGHDITTNYELEQSDLT